MARRIRTIKPEILEDEKAAGLSSDAWRLWVSMWVMADDLGRLRAEPRRLTADIFWACPHQVSIEDCLEELATARLIQRYAVRGQSYVAIVNWSKHQRIDNASKNGNLPGPEEGESIPLAASRREPPRAAAGSGPGSGPGKDLEGKGPVAADEPPPLPFKPDEAIAALAASGRFTATKLNKGQAINAVRLIREYPNLSTWKLVGEWLAAGGESWRQHIDVRALSDMTAWVVHAVQWDGQGRHPVMKANGHSPPVRNLGYRAPIPPHKETKEVKL